MDTALRRQLAIWLLLVAACVFGMVVVGGLTRLTESGLSIVEWKPVSGTLPPLSAESWQAEFDAYRTSPQYRQVNKGMSLEEFKGIFWLEYWHRVGGRLIGFVFLLPMLWFFFRHRLPGWVKWRLLGIFALGGLQGFVGWYMVKSGLVDVPQVSQYRLALHLGVAFLIMGACIWVAREILDSASPIPRSRESSSPEVQAAKKVPAFAGMTGKKLSIFAALLTALIFVQVLLGALVAGLDAGLTYNTFPLMDGRFVPKGLYALDPAWRNHFENVAMVQFQHRIGAYVLAAVVPLFAILAWRRVRKTGIKIALVLLCAFLLLQIGLGILTLIHVVPIMLASKHQAVAAILFALSVWVWFDFRYLAQQVAEDGEPADAGMNAKWQTART